MVRIKIGTISGAALGVACAFWAMTSPAATLGPRVLVNTTVDGDQWPVDTAVAPNGDVLVLWNDPTRGGVTVFKRYRADGSLIDAVERSLSVDITQGDQQPRLGRRSALDRQGNFAILRTAPDGSGTGIFASLFDRQGNPRMPELRVNDSTAGHQVGPSIAMNEAGELVATWLSGRSLYAKRYASDGTPRSPEILVGQNFGNLDSPTSGIDAYGNFTVVWQDVIDLNAASYATWRRRFRSDGAPLGPQERVNNGVPGSAARCFIAMAPSGNSVVVWWGLVAGASPRYFNTYAQRYDATGAAIGSPFRVNGSDWAPSSPLSLEAAMTDNGSFIVGFGTQYRQYRNDGTPLETAGVWINKVGNSYFAMDRPRLAVDLVGRVTVSSGQWPQSVNEDIFLNRLVLDTVPSAVDLANGQVVSNLAGGAGTFQYFKLLVPEGKTTLEASIFGSGATGDADLYLRYAAFPTLDAWDGRPYLTGSNERAVITGIPAGEWYVGIQGYSSFSGVSLSVIAR
jgi:hypothetical protein